jgi:hypothetical protein
MLHSTWSKFMMNSLADQDSSAQVLIFRSRILLFGLQASMSVFSGCGKPRDQM